jgi:hypothetical protein
MKELVVFGVVTLLLGGWAAPVGTAAPEPYARGHGATAFQTFTFSARGNPLRATGAVTAHIPIKLNGDP